MNENSKIPMSVFHEITRIKVEIIINIKNTFHILDSEQNLQWSFLYKVVLTKKITIAGITLQICIVILTFPFQLC